MTPTIDLYQSRTEKEAAIIMRQDPVVHPGGPADAAGCLSQHQLARYRRKGFLVVQNLFSADEVARLLAEVERLASAPELARREEMIREPGGGPVRSVFRVHDLSPLIGRLARDPRLLNVARQVLGGEVYIHQSRANLKPGFRGREFYWHSDFETWHAEDGMPRMRALSCSLLLTPNTEHNGPLMLIPGSHMQFIQCVGKTPEGHYKESLRKQEYGVPDELSLRFLADRAGIESAKGPAGSVVFFDCNTMHGSASNISPYPRSNVFMVYNSVENTLGEPLGGLAPRPEFVATRGDFSPLAPLEDAPA